MEGEVIKLEASKNNEIAVEKERVAQLLQQLSELEQLVEVRLLNSDLMVNRTLIQY